MSFGAGAVALAAASGFALGLAAALIAVGVTRLAAEDRRISLPFRFGSH